MTETTRTDEICMELLKFGSMEVNGCFEKHNTKIKNMVIDELKNKNEEDNIIVVSKVFELLKFNYPNTEDFSGFVNRKQYTKTFSWAIFDIFTIMSIINFAENQIILEVASGNGFLSKLIELLGGEIIPTEPMNGYCDFKLFYSRIRKLNAVEAVIKYPTNVLLMCWPSYLDNYAINALQLFNGDKFIFIGEDKYGCTANDAFFDYLEEKWTLAKKINIQNWYGIYDTLNFYERKI